MHEPVVAEVLVERTFNRYLTEIEKSKDPALTDALIHDALTGAFPDTITRV